MKWWTLALAETTEDSGWLRINARPGDKVLLPNSEWVVTITPESLDCDCGKGVLCPSNPQEKYTFRRVL